MATNIGIPTVLGSLPPVNDTEFNNKCLTYFKKQYMKRISSAKSLEKYPLDVRLDDGILPYLLNDQLFFFSCRLVQIEQERFEYHEFRYYLSWFLWEMFGLQPEQFLKLHAELVPQTDSETGKLDRSTDEKLPRTWTGLESILGGIFESRIVPTFLSMWGDLCDIKLDTGHLRSNAEATIMRQLEVLFPNLKAGQLEGCWTHLTEPAKIRPNNVEELRYQLPLYNGLYQYIRSQYPGRMQQLLQLSLNGIPDLSSLHDPVGHSVKLPDPKDGNVFLLFNDMGTGETQAILNTLCERWGIYLMAPSLEPYTLYKDVNAQLNTTSDDVEDISGTPQRYFASSDTYSAFKDSESWSNEKRRLGYWRERNATTNPSQKFAAELHITEAMLDANAILKARLALLQTYKLKSQSKIQWALLQISRTLGDDPFDIAYRLHRLISLNYENLRSTKMQQNDQSVELFIDESQHSIGNTIAEHIQDLLIQLSPMTYLSGSSFKLLEVLNHVSRYNSRISVYDNFEYVEKEEAFERVLLKHTECTTREEYELRKRGIKRIRFPSLFRGGKPLESRLELPKGDDWSIVDKALKQWDIFKESGRKMIRKVCRAFFGRSHWTSLFADELLRITSKDKGSLSEKRLQEVRTRTTQSIKVVVNRQNENAKRYAGLLRLMPFTNPAMKKIIEAKFESVNIELGVEEPPSGRTRRFVSETIRVEMVTEHYSKSMLQFTDSLRKKQSKHDHFTSSSRYLFAKMLDDFLRLSTSPGDKGDTIAFQHRNNFLSQIQGARKWRDSTTFANLKIDFSEYTLNGTRLVSSETVFLNESVRAWLSNNNRSTFLFPDDDESPSLLFFLRKQGQGRTTDSSHYPSILCSMKFVTGDSRSTAWSELSIILRKLVVSTSPSSFPVVHIFVSNLLGIPTGMLEDILNNRLSLEALQGRKSILAAMEDENKKLGGQSKTVGETIKSVKRAVQTTADNKVPSDDLKGQLEELFKVADRLRGEKTKYYAPQDESWLGNNHYVHCIDKKVSEEIWPTSK
ncbi:hypothetical protein F4806DRAFT_503220 [Annulohypoxylon nitens]|nr:hypothetical protein F4806DRAFT_503220 [Annulohypoxylon nitens]